MKQRAAAKQRSREKLVSTARRLFETEPYEATTIRGIAQAAGASTGFVYGHFPDKESLWRESMGTPPPVDSALTRAAPALLTALQGLVEQRASSLPLSDDLWTEAEQAIEAAKGEYLGMPTTSTDGLRMGDVKPRRLNRFMAHVSAEVQARRRLPPWRTIMAPVLDLCEILVSYAEQQVSESEVHDAAVAACATIAQVGINGARDIPYRAASEQPALLPSANGDHGAA